MARQDRPRRYLHVIIDGYNFLKTTGMMDLNVPDSQLERARNRLLQFLKRSFPQPEDRRRITVVFDSLTLLDLPHRLKEKGFEVLFSRGYDSADELIIEMIQNSHTPKQMLIVSSDHEIQQSAQRRRANFVDSDVWLDQLENGKFVFELANDKQDFQERNPTEKPADSSSEFWLAEFADIDLQSISSEVNEGPGTAADDSPTDSDNIADNISDGKANGDAELGAKDGFQPERTEDPFSEEEKKQIERELLEDVQDLFPPGYGEDLLDDEMDT